MDERIRILKKVPLVSGLQDREYGAVLEVCRIRRYLDGDVIMEEGASGHELYVLLSGEVEIATRANGVLRTLGPGDVLGEIAIVGHMLRTATVTSKGNSVLLALDSGALDLLVGKAPRASYLIMRNIAATLAERLTTANRRQVTQG